MHHGDGHSSLREVVGSFVKSPQVQAVCFGASLQLTSAISLLLLQLGSEAPSWDLLDLPLGGFFVKRIHYNYCNYCLQVQALGSPLIFVTPSIWTGQVIAMAPPKVNLLQQLIAPHDQVTSRSRDHDRHLYNLVSARGSNSNGGKCAIGS